MEDKIYLLARMFNTLKEMARTSNDEWMSDEFVQEFLRLTDYIDDYVLKSDNFSEKQKEEFISCTDMIQNRIYFIL
jgi:uncharacterized membrane protein YgaE (UPF0421/DUF939 family)